MSSSLVLCFSRVCFKKCLVRHFERWGSVLGWSRSETPHVVPVRGSLEGIRRLIKGGCYVGRGSKQRGLKRSDFGNPYKVSVYGRAQAKRKYGDTLARDEVLRGKVWSLLVAVWFVTARQNRSAMPILSMSAGVSSRAPTIAKIQTLLLPRRQHSTSFHVSGRSKTRQKGRLRTRQHHRRPPESGDRENRWKSELVYTSREICDGQRLA